MGTSGDNKLRSQELDLRTALFLAAVCGQTYMQFNNKDGLFLVPRSYSLAGGFTAKGVDNSEERFGFVLTSERASVLAFRGSGSAVDWVADFIAQQTSYRPVKNAGLTHKGFTDIYMSARNQIINIVKQLPADRPLFVTGHSLGGALATLASIDLAVNSAFNNPIVYTFGAPRVGDPRFVSKYNATVASHWRFQNEFDIVPHLPTLVYQSPKTKQTYYYMHVKGEVKRSFRMGSIAGNHVLPSYFADLAREEPLFAVSVCAEPPGWCPAVEL
ncbi:lipase family protein [Paenibacillus alkaliterrae]|uniref:lipase family protein n=1 Tax=Paenibacillus alkaliterrae TaxID=320909 RepID=UPI001F2B9E30|nr:lipase family protein [Paenibacillus alkaliterrae]MCF2939216.1 lipase family protein [Paenibacillus alkaliterrae]